MIGHHDEGRVVVPAAALQILKQLADDLVGIRDLTVVGVHRSETGGRCVRLVWLVNVKKKENCLSASVSSQRVAAASVCSPGR